MRFKKTSKYVYDTGTPYSLNDILYSSLDGNPCRNRMGQLEELASKVEKQEEFLIKLVEVLPEEIKIKLAEALGYVELE